MKYMIFGAGIDGKSEYGRLGAGNVDYFIDNNTAKQGSFYCGIPIISVDEAATKKNDYHVIATGIYADSMIKQLVEYEFPHYSKAIEGLRGYFENMPLIVNTYETTPESESEEEWSKTTRVQLARQAVNDEAERIHDKKILFNHVEIETINRCNGICSFCPINRNVDSREKKVMSEILFRSIIAQLKEIEYDGRLALFSNNEPLLDDRIIDFHRYARQQVPKARMHMFTNGTLMTLEKFKALVEVLDELVIDNYNQELKLIKSCKEIADYCNEHPELISKVTIVLRKPNEILTSRGGNAPNRRELIEYGQDKCVLPYKQMIIRPDGKVSLCCNDAIGKFSLGDLNSEKLLDVWYGPRFSMVRKCLYEGRENWGQCKLCDTFSLG